MGLGWCEFGVGVFWFWFGGCCVLVLRVGCVFRFCTLVHLYGKFGCLLGVLVLSNFRGGLDVLEIV